MVDNNKTMKSTVLRLLSLVVAVVLFAMSWRVGNQVAKKLDAEMREQELRQAATIAGTINPDLARKLTFTAADKGNPAYEIIRGQMIAYGKRVPSRGIYSMFLRDGKIFFGPENYDESDPMASPSGTEYEQPSPGVFEVFKAKRPVTVGPEADEYGTFVSALVPVLDPRTSEILMVVGMDILANDWQSKLNGAFRKPVITTLVLIFLFAGGVIAIHWYNRREKRDTLKFKVWIITPTVMAMLGGLLLSEMLMYLEFDEHSRHDMIRSTEQTLSAYNQTIAANVTLMRSQMDYIATDPALLKAWQQRDIASLTALTQPFYGQLKLKYGITHYHLIAPDITYFFRAHQHDQRDALSNCATLLVAEKTGEDAWGVELGNLGSLTLHYVRPWKKDGALIGYLEMGVEIDDILDKIVRDGSLDILTFLRKEYITRDNFEVGRKAFGFSGQWDGHPDFVALHQTVPALPGEIESWLKHSQTIKTEMLNAHIGEKYFSCGVVHLFDVANRNVAELVLMRDVTAETVTVRNFLFFAMVLEVVIFGGILVMLWSVAGAAERKLGKFVKELRESEENFRELTETIQDVFWSTTPDFQKIIYVSSAYEQIWGRSVESLHYNPVTWIEVIEPEDRVFVLAALERLIQGVSYDLEYRIRRPDGTGRWIHDRGFLLRDAKGMPYRTVGVAKDITERKKAAEEKASLELQLQESQKMDAVGQLTSGIYHDFKNLLSIISGYAEMIIKDPRLNASLAPQVGEILNAGERGGKLIHHILMFSRRQPMESRIIDLNAVVLDISTMLRRIISGNIRMEILEGADLWHIKANTVQIEQITMNLVINARDAMTEGGTLTIKTENAIIDGSTRIGIHTNIEPGHYVMLIVSDTGHGMDDKVSQRIFEPFFTTKEAGKGTGLGLSTVFSIIKQSNAHIDVQSEVGKGTSFRIYFPKAAIEVSIEEKRQEPAIIPRGS